MSRGVFILLSRLAAASVVCFIVLCLAGSCQRRPLLSGDNNVVVNINIDYDIMNYPEKETLEPERMRVMLFDNESHDFATHYFMPAEGGTAGVISNRTYHVLTYNFDSESVIVGSEDDWGNIFATTNEISSYYKSMLKSRGTKYEGEKIVYEPEHHFVGLLQDQYIPTRSSEAPPVEIDLNAKTIVETWKFEVDKVQGREWIASIACVISGLALSKSMTDMQKSAETASVFFEVSLEDEIDENGHIESRFNTFGYNPESTQTVSIVITDISGQGHEYNIDISKEFRNNEKTRTVLISTEEIVIEKPETGGGSGGGLDPDVEDWGENIEYDINI